MKLNLELQSSYEALELLEGLLKELQIALDFDDDLFYARLIKEVYLRHFNQLMQLFMAISSTLQKK